MAESFRKLVVRSYAPRRRAVLLCLCAGAGLIALYGSFELGRYDAGYRVVASVRSAWAASRRIRQLEAENAQQRAQIAAAEVARRVDRAGSAQLQHSLTDMQGQIARLNQDLAFYQGLVQPDSVVRVKVQQMQILSGAGANRFRLKFVLMQVGKPSGTVAGRIDLAIEGSRNGRPETLQYAQMAPGSAASLSYSFRYFQDFDQPLQLPAGFAPSRIDVALHAGRDRGRGYRQAFLWNTQGVTTEADSATSAGSKGVADVQAPQEK
ncbi:MAG: hypothetical protein KGL34_04960 [Gammaproteobacteria bacterium]|nr:hypothetical protein [Gammaproteobacteria bacterium]